MATWTNSDGLRIRFAREEASSNLDGGSVSEGYKTYNVVSAGAIGDGVTDSTTAFQRCITAAERFAPYGIVEVPEGTYLVSGLTITKKINIFGKGKLHSVIKLKNGSNTSVFTYTGETTGASYANLQPQLRDIGINGNKANQSGTSHGIYFPDVAYSVDTDYAFSLSIFECDIRDCLTNGIRIGNNRNAGNFTRGSVKDCGSSGIHIGSASDWHLHHFGSGGNGGYGVYNVGGQSLRIFDPDIYSNTLSGIRMDSTANGMWVTGGSIDRNYQNGVYLAGDSGSPYDRRTVFIGTKFYKNSMVGTNQYSHFYLNDHYGGAAIGCLFDQDASVNAKYIVNFNGASGRFRLTDCLWNRNAAPWGTALTDNFIELIQSGNSSMYDTASAVTAAGTTISDAFSLVYPINRVSTGAANSGVKLPTASYHGQSVHVTNTTGNTILVYPQSTQQINVGGNGVSSSLSNGSGREYRYDATIPSWYSYVR